MPTRELPPHDQAWVLPSVVGGLGALLSYTLLITVSATAPLSAALAFGFAFGLTVASLGLFHLVAAPIAPRLGLIAVTANTVAAAQLTAMLLVQIAVKQLEPAPPRAVVAIWLGLDVAWDLYVGVGTLAFALCMLRHPGFRAWLGAPGIVIAVLLLALNLATFPTPPGEAGLVDVGPLVGLWYVAVTIRVAWVFRRRAAG